MAFDEASIHGHVSISQPRRAIQQETRRVEVHGHVGNLERHRLKRANRSTELKPLVRVALRRLEASCEDAHGLRRDAKPARARDSQARSCSPLLLLQADVLAATRASCRTRSTVFDEWMPSLSAVRPTLKPTRLLVHKKRGESLGPVAARAPNTIERCSVAAVCDPLLGPVEHIFVAALFRSRAQTRRVRT